MSVRKRAWTTSKGVEKEAWIVDYVDQAGKRHLKTFSTKKAADNFAATANVEVRAGTHTADSESVTIAKAGKLWIETCERAGLERATVDAYRQHLRLHIEPYLGNVKLSQLSVPAIREFEDRLSRGDMPEGKAPQPRSPAMVRKARVSLSSLVSDALERGLVSRNVVRELKEGRRWPVGRLSRWRPSAGSPTAATGRLCKRLAPRRRLSRASAVMAHEASIGRHDRRAGVSAWRCVALQTLQAKPTWKQRLF